MGIFRKRIQIIWLTVAANLDLYALSLAGFIFTILGVAGIADTKTLSSVILAFLTLLAFSLVRLRAALPSDARNYAEAIFRSTFPRELDEHRRTATHTYLYIGVSGYRTIGAGGRDIQRMLERGPEVRILLLDPANDATLAMAARNSHGAQPPQRIKEKILSSLSELRTMADNPRLQIRLAPFVPHVGINAFDTEDRSGRIYVQRYEYKSSDEASPIYSLGTMDGHWYRHQLAECERMWNDSKQVRDTKNGP